MWTIRAKLALIMIAAFAPPMAVLSLVTTRLMQTALARQTSVTLEYVTAQTSVALNRDLSNLQALLEQRLERMEQTVAAGLGAGAVADLVARGRHAEAGAYLADLLAPSGASMISVVALGGRTIARATDPDAYGDFALWNQHLEAPGSVTSLRRAARAALGGRGQSGIAVFAAATLERERVTPVTAIAGFTHSGDRLADQAWLLLESGRAREARGLALTAVLPLRDGGGAVRGAAIAARLLNRDPELAETYRRLSGRWMAMTLGEVVVQGNLPTERRSVIGEMLPARFAGPVLRQGKQRWTARLASTGIELNVAAAPLRDLDGRTVGMLIVGAPLTEMQMVVDRMQADAARLESRSLLTLLLWLCVGVAVSFASAALAARGITRPIRQLRDGARRIGDGDFSFRLQVRSGDELEGLAQEFNQMAQHLEQARDQERLAVIGRMASGIVHDIQNALTSIRGAAALLGEADLPAAQRQEFAAVLVESVQRIADMARDLLEYARGEEAKLNLRPMTVDDYLRELRPRLERDLGQSNIALTLDLHCPELVNLDPERMNRVIFNLVANARDAMGESGTFTIASRCAPAHVEIRCSDTGPGIPPQVRDRLFQPFVSYGKPYGTGLGLAICKQVIQAHGGTIEERSTPGQGATFVIRLPRAQTTDGAPGAPRAGLPSPTAAGE